MAPEVYKSIVTYHPRIPKFFGLPKIHTPHIGPFPVPTALLIGGLLLGFLLGVVVRLVANRKARARRARAARRLDAAIADVALKEIAQPVLTVLEAHRRTREALARARH